MGWKCFQGKRNISLIDGIYIPIQSRFLTNVIRLCLLSRGSWEAQQSPATDTLLILFSFIGSNLCFLFSASTSTCFQLGFSTLFELATVSLRHKMYVFCIYTKLYFFFSFLGVVGWDDVIKHSAPGPLRVWMVWGFLVCKMDKRKTLGDNVN